MFAYWSVRDREWSGRELTAAGAVWDHTPDDALDLPHHKISVGEGFNIGLSLRDWDSSDANDTVQRILSDCSLDFRVHLIPHIVAESNRFDITAMRAAFPGVSYGFEFFRANAERVDIAVKSLTAAMDLVIATRYHGAVFAVTAPTRCIALYEGEYYQRKMEGLGSWDFPHLLVKPITSSLMPDELRTLLAIQPRPHSLALITPTEIVDRARMRGQR
jgi:polysaccharide pyruvyl transferase WcaK-like protein